MRKIQIAAIAAAGLISFAAAFGLTWWIKQQLSTAAASSAPLRETVSTPPDHREGDQSFTSGGMVLKESMNEQELKTLIFEIREKMKDYTSRERTLAQEQQRIEAARKTLEADVERLSQLHDALNIATARLKQQETTLNERLIEMTATEKANLQRIGATYDRMDAAQASRIIINMAANKQLQDAVKIIHLMSERTAAKLLGEISLTKPDLASLLSTELKYIKERE